MSYEHMHVDLTHLSHNNSSTYKWLSFGQVVHQLPLAHQLLITCNSSFKVLQPPPNLSSFSNLPVFATVSMEIYSSVSSFEANLTLQTQNSFRDASFSSYLNKAEENMIRKLTNQASDIPKDHHYPLRKNSEDEELGVFGAEKYFKGEIEDVDNKNNGRRFLDTTNTSSKMYQEHENFEESDHSSSPKQKTDQLKIRPPSVRSNVSCNSRSGLLPRTKQAPRKTEKGSKTRVFLASFGCNCINKKSTQISEKRFIQAKEISNKKTDIFSSKPIEKNTRNDCFSFPVLNSNNSSSNLNSKTVTLAGKNQNEGDNNGSRLSLGRKLSLLNDWDVEIPTEDEMYIPSSVMYNHNNDNDSDSSSDLFEIESFSTNGNTSFLPHRASESDCYAPSEVSIQWSVVTASAADFSVASDFDDVRTGHVGGGRNSGGRGLVMDQKEEVKKRPGILSGCTDHKAVRVAGGERARRRSADCMAVGSMFRGVNSLTRFDPIRGNYGSDVCPIS